MLKKTCFLLATLLSSSYANASYTKDLGVYRYYQDDKCWCSVTTLEMWKDWIDHYSFGSNGDQEEFASTYKVGKFKLYPDGSWDCVNGGGMNQYELTTALNKEVDSGSFSGKFKVGKIYQDKQLPGFIAKNILRGQPVILVGNTVYTNGSAPRPAGHYFLIRGVKVKTQEIADEIRNSSFSSWSKYYDDIEGFYINDPAYIYSDRIFHITKNKLIDKNTLINKLAAKKSFGQAGGVHYELIYNTRVKETIYAER